MIGHHTLAEVRQFYRFKLAVPVILLVLLIAISVARRNDSLRLPAEAQGSVPTAAAVAETSAVALARPRLTVPAAGQALAVGETVRLQGSGTPGSQVRVSHDGRILDTLEVAADGTWTTVFTMPDLADTSFLLEALDETGVVRIRTRTVKYPIAPPTPDMAVPELDPTVTELAVGEQVLAGRGTPGSTVAVWLDGVLVGTAIVDQAGHWQLPHTFDAPGRHTLELRALAPDGQVAATAQPVALTVRAHLAPPTLALPDQPDALRVGEFTFRGGGTPGTTVEITVDGELVGSVVVDEAGSWSHPYRFAEPGTYQVALRGLHDDAVIDGDTATATVAPAGALLALAAADGRFTTLLAALEAADLAPLLQGDGPFTLFAPTDEAFAALPDASLSALLAHPDRLAEILRHHVVNGIVLSETAVPSATVTTLSDALLTLATVAGEMPTVDGATVIQASQPATNGLLHTIDAILWPPAGVAVPVIDESGVPVFVGGLLTIVGTAEPGTTLLIELNGVFFGSTTVNRDGTWLVADNVTTGEYFIVAYTLDELGIPLAVSKTIFLVSP